MTAAPSPSVVPFLMFEGKAEEAISLYVATIPGSHLVEMNRYGPEGPGRQGTVQTGRAVIGGTAVMFIDSPVAHAFSFTPAVSFFITCTSEEEQDRIAMVLGADGQTLMPLDNYGFSRRFCWLNDRYGVSWQINLP
ncbi:VOC family protein [Zavarzinia sp. CC-PAN008]|uniref:VOC family protein n=1 Tax=Zavarzinia sp. CC-PAN008 TaxID=3243332 RepID=UPI003F749655